MAALKIGMTHDEAAAHLRDHVAGIAKRETAPLIELDPPGFFSAVLIVMCAIDYTGALYAGSNATNPRDAVTSGKAIGFIHEVIAKATGNQSYREFAALLHGIYRHGLVHLGQPTAFEAAGSGTSSKYVSWRISKEGAHLELREARAGSDTSLLSISMRDLVADFIAGCEHFARTLEEERDKGEDSLLTRWRQTADLLAKPTVTARLKWQGS